MPDPSPDLRAVYPSVADVVERAVLTEVLLPLGKVLSRMKERPLSPEDDSRLRKLELAECLILHAMPPETRPAPDSIFKD